MNKNNASTHLKERIVEKCSSALKRVQWGYGCVIHNQSEPDTWQLQPRTYVGILLVVYTWPISALLGFTIDMGWLPNPINMIVAPIHLLTSTILIIGTLSVLVSFFAYIVNK